MSKPKCPKCGRKFKSKRGFPAHIEACEGKTAKAPRKSRKPRQSPAPPRRSAARRTPKPPREMQVHIEIKSSIVERLSAAKAELEAKAAALGRMIEELGDL